MKKKRLYKEISLKQWRHYNGRTTVDQVARILLRINRRGLERNCMRTNRKRLERSDKEARILMIIN